MRRKRRKQTGRKRKRRGGMDEKGTEWRDKKT